MIRIKHYVENMNYKVLETNATKIQKYGIILFFSSSFNFHQYLFLIHIYIDCLLLSQDKHI